MAWGKKNDYDPDAFEPAAPGEGWTGGTGQPAPDTRDAVPPPEPAPATPTAATPTAATTTGRRPRSDKGKPRAPKPPPSTDHYRTFVDLPDGLLAQVLERIRGAQAAFLEEEDCTADMSVPERRGHLLLEEALVIGEGRDLVEWLRSKVFPAGRPPTGGGAP